MGTRWVGAGLAVLVIGVVVWLAMALTADDETAPDAPDSGAILDFAPDPDAQTLADGANWELLVNPDRSLRLFQGDKQMGGPTVSGYADPPVLNEAASFLVGPPNNRRTLVAGPVHEEAERVVVLTPGGRRAEAEVIDAHGLRWFWSEFAGAAAISAIEATDATGQTVAELTLPTIPPPSPVIVREGTPRELREAAEKASLNE